MAKCKYMPSTSSENSFKFSERSVDEQFPLRNNSLAVENYDNEHIGDYSNMTHIGNEALN